MKKLAVVLLTAILEATMKKIAVLFVAALLAGCGKESTAVSTTPHSGSTEARPAPPAQKKPKWQGYPRLSPFEAVRWRESVPEVRVKGVWYELLSLNGLSSKEIVAFCKSVDKREWQKRFEEDLIEVLSLMGHDANKRATLKVRQLDSGEDKTLKDVPMTEENRKALWKARQQRSHRDVRPGHDAADFRLTRRQAEADLDQLASLLEQRYAYLQRKGIHYRAALDAIRKELGEGVSVKQFACRMMKVLALFGDGHSGVAGADRYLPKGYTPFLIGDADGRLAAFKEDRSGFLDLERPYLRSLDGAAIEKWLAAAGRIAPAGAPQLLRWHSIRNLRYVNHLRQELGLEAKATLQVELTSADIRPSRTIEVKLAERKPIYGDWPRGTHRLLDGDVGHLRIASMSGDPRFVTGLVQAMNDFRRTAGLILDVRGNGGGSRAVLQALAPFFQKADDPLRVVNVAACRLGEGEKDDNPEGYLADRSLYPLSSRIWSDAERGILREFAERFKPEWTPPRGQFSRWHLFVLRPRSGENYYYYDRPVVILMDSGCFSATDILLSAFKGLPKVTLMGTPSGGGSGRPNRVELTHSGIALYLSSMISFQANGQLYDGRGILPDVEVSITATDLIGTTDTVLDAAMKRIRHGEASNASSSTPVLPHR
jgi:hypothetical protein